MGSVTFRFAPEHVRYMHDQVFQCRHDLSVYGRLCEFEHEQVRGHIGAPRKVMDLGSGIGRAGVYLWHRIGNPALHVVFVDSTGDTDLMGSPWGPDAPWVYNDLSLTESFARLNGVTSFEVFDFARDDWSTISDVDLVISHCSVGMHYPVEDVMPRLLDVTTDDCTMIFGTVNRDRAWARSFEDLFEEVLFLEQEEVEPFPHQDWLVLKRKRATSLAERSA